MLKFQEDFQVLSKITFEDCDEIFEHLYYTHEDGRLDYDEFIDAISEHLKKLND